MPLELKLDPRVQTSQADLEAQFNLLMEIREQLNRVYAAANQIEDVRAQTEGLSAVCPTMTRRARWRSSRRRINRQAGVGPRTVGESEDLCQ